MIDSHCHIHSLDYKLNVKQVINDAKKNNVDQMIVIATDKEDSLTAIDFANQHQNIFSTVGVHPHYAKRGCDFLHKINWEEPKIVAIGEIGLDYHYNFSDRNQQIDVLNQQIAIAQAHNLPIVFHVREAFDDFWPIFDNFSNIKGVLHSFSDNLKNLNKGLERGLFIGVNGLITFTKDNEQLEAYRQIPLDRLLLETDSPYMTPKPFRGQINQPAYIKNIVEFISEFRQIPINKIAHQTTQNAKDLFKI